MYQSTWKGGLEYGLCYCCLKCDVSSVVWGLGSFDWCAFLHRSNDIKKCHVDDGANVLRYETILLMWNLEEQSNRTRHGTKQSYLVWKHQIKELCWQVLEKMLITIIISHLCSQWALLVLSLRCCAITSHFLNRMGLMVAHFFRRLPNAHKSFKFHQNLLFTGSKLTLQSVQKQLEVENIPTQRRKRRHNEPHQHP